MMKTLKSIPFEAWIWMGGLIVLACINPSAEHYSLCPLKHLGISWCPGCGLGRSVSYLLHGELKSSFQAHPLGGFAAATLAHRIGFLVKNGSQSIF